MSVTAGKPIYEVDTYFLFEEVQFSFVPSVINSLGDYLMNWVHMVLFYS